MSGFSWFIRVRDSCEFAGSRWCCRVRRGGFVLHLIVAGLVQEHLVSMAAEQISFLSKDLVLTTGCLVRIVDGENLHSDHPLLDTDGAVDHLKDFARC